MPEPIGARGRDEGPDGKAAAQDVRDAVAAGDASPAPSVSGPDDSESAYTTEQEQGAAQPGPG